MCPTRWNSSCWETSQRAPVASHVHNQLEAATCITGIPPNLPTLRSLSMTLANSCAAAVFSAHLSSQSITLGCCILRGIMFITKLMIRDKLIITSLIEWSFSSTLRIFGESACLSNVTRARELADWRPIVLQSSPLLTAFENVEPI